MKRSSVVFTAVATLLGAGAAQAAAPTAFDAQAAYCEALLSNQRDAVRQLPGAVGGNPELTRVVDARVAKIGDQLDQLAGYLAPRRTSVDLAAAARDVSLDQMTIAQAVSDAGCLTSGAGPAQSMACGRQVRETLPAAQRQSTCVNLSWLPR